MGTPPAQRAAGFWHELRGGVAEVRERRWMWTFMPALSAYHLVALPCVLALGPVIADRDLGGVSAGFTLWETTLGREIPPEALSRVTSLDWFTTAGLRPLGFAAVAAVAAAGGTRATMLVASLVVLALLCVALVGGMCGGCAWRRRLPWRRDYAAGERQQRWVGRGWDGRVPLSPRFRAVRCCARSTVRKPSHSLRFPHSRFPAAPSCAETSRSPTSLPSRG